MAYEVETIGGWGTWDARLQRGCACASSVARKAEDIGSFLDAARDLLRRAKGAVPDTDPIPYAHALVGPRGWGDLMTKVAVVAGIAGAGVVAYRLMQPKRRSKR